MRLSLLLVLLSVSVPLGSSVKEDILSRLIAIQGQLLQAKQSIENSEQQIGFLQSKIYALEQSLQTSEEIIKASSSKIDELEKSLLESRVLLEQSQTNLEKEQALYSQLYLEYRKLSRSLVFFQTSTAVLAVGCLILIIVR